MRMNEYQDLARRTQNPGLNLTERKEHALMGMVSEVGEICAHWQKVHQGHAMDVDAVIGEVGDLMWFIAELCDVLRVDLETVAARNIDKLRRRYPQGFDEGRSLHREPEMRKTLMLRCYGEPEECGYSEERAGDPERWCTKFDRFCRDVHVWGYAEDGDDV